MAVMKAQYLFFAIATLFGLVACNNNEPEKPIVAGQPCTLTAIVHFSEGTDAPIRRIAPDPSTLSDTPESIVDFFWEEGDSVILVNGSESQVFRLTDGAGTTTATFTGTALNDMSSYKVYTFDTTKNEQRVKYQNNTFRPFAKGSGSDAAFTIDKFYPVLHFGMYTNDQHLGDGGLVTFDSIQCTNEVITTKLIFDSSITLKKDDPLLDVYCPLSFVTTSKWRIIIGKPLYVGEEEGTLSDIQTKLEYNQLLHFSVALRAESSCLAAGTRITMADGSYKNVEDIVEGDMVRTFDHEAGQFSSAKVCLALHDGNNVPTELHFASGNTLTFAGTHGFLEESTRHYINIQQSNVAQFVGKRFYNAQLGSWDELVSYNAGTKSVDRYAIYSSKHLNVIAENMLTVEDDVNFLLNIYELDATLKADSAQLAADIAQYGLCDVARDFPEYAVYKEQMEDLGSEYAYIAIGKGLVPKNYIEQMKSYWNGK